MSLAKLMAQMGGDDEDDAPKMLPEAQVMELRDFLDRYTITCPFKRGDLVTPRKSATVKGDGLPHIVIEVLAEPIVPQAHAVGDYGSNAMTRRLTMDVASIRRGSIFRHYVDHNEFEPYRGPVA